jgi:serpin B
MSKERWLHLLALVAILSAAGCAGVPGGLAPAAGVVRSDKQRLVSPDVPEGDLADLVAGNSEFAFDLYQALRQEQDGNLFYSPYSISLALAMTYAGAQGETAAQMAETLHYTLPQAQLHAAFNELDVALTSGADQEDGFQINVANAIWGQEGYEFLSAFLDTLAENYGAGLRTVDFVEETEATRRTINDWVSEQTEEKIPNLIPQGTLNALTRLVLTNAIYFNAKWVAPFEKDRTHDEPFNLLDGSTVSVPMMTQTESLHYAAGQGYQAVALPYLGSDMAMLFVLPDEDSFAKIEAALSAQFLADVVQRLESQRVRITVPKFTFESSFRLTETLARMGMPDAFVNADFSGMTGAPDLFISDVLHKAFVAVDEEGTEAAAATAVIMQLSAAIGDQPVQMKLDRPFFFVIRDNATGTVLFAGRVLNPEP